MHHPIDEEFVDEDRARLLFRIGRRQRAAAEHWRANDVEETWVDGHDPRAVLRDAVVVAVVGGAALRLDRIPPETHQRHLIGVRDAEHARLISESVGERAVACFEPHRTHRRHRVSARRHAVTLARLPKQQAEPDFADEVAGRIDDRERTALVRKALAALGKAEREVLALCVFSGLDYAEAAEALGVPVGTVRSRLSRARQRLRKLVATGKLRPSQERREPLASYGQVIADRTIAVRLTQENAR